MSPATNSLKNVQSLAGAELSLKVRIGYVALLLVSAAMTAVVASLWLTEPSLPLRTRVAFGVMCVIGLGWCALASWVLRARRPLFARDRVIAARMAVSFSALFVVGSLAAVIAMGNSAAYGSLATGVAMLGVAIVALIKGHRRFAALAARRSELERALRM